MRYFFIFFLFYIGLGAYFSGLSPFVTGIYGADARYVFLAAQIAAPAGFFLAGYFSDRTKQLRILLLFSLMGVMIGQFFLFSAPPFAAAVFASALLRLSTAAATQLITIAGLEAQGSFALARTFGTWGFFLVQLALFAREYAANAAPIPQQYILEQTGYYARLAVVFHLMTFALAIGIPRWRISQTAYHFRAAWQLVRSRVCIQFFALAFVFHAIYQLVDYYVGGYLSARAGLDAVYGGWALAVLLELGLMPLTGRWQGLWRGNFLFLISLAAGALRFAWLSVPEYLPIDLVYSQVLHGIHFTGFYMGAIFLLKRVFPSHLYGTGYALFVVISLSGGGMTGNLITGWLIGDSPAQVLPSLFAVAAGISVVLLFAFLLLSPGKIVANKTGQSG